MSFLHAASPMVKPGEGWASRDGGESIEVHPRGRVRQIRRTLRRRAFGFDPATYTDRRTLHRAMAYLWFAGGVFTVASVALGVAPGSNVPALLLLASFALITAGTFWFGQNVIPTFVLPLVVSLGTLVITGLMWFDAAPTSAYALFYVWAALYAYYFFGRSGAAVQAVIIAVSSGVELSLHRPSAPVGGRWLLIVGTVVISGLWVQQLVAQVRQLTRTDGLTGAANRRHLDAELPYSLARASRSGQPLAVALLDLDLFKQFNDQRGHAAGDRQLIDTVETWRTQLRGGDLLVRLGGEEFLVVFAVSSADEARDVADRMRRAVPNGQTCSAGIALWDGEEDAGQLIARADEAMYRAKLDGRNRVELAAGRAEDEVILRGIVPVKTADMQSTRPSTP